MIPQSDVGLNASLKSFSVAASALVIVIGHLVLVGWMLDIEVLKSFLPGLTRMNPTTALLFILSGVSLWLLRRAEEDRSGWRFGRGVAFIIALMGLLKLAAYLFGWDFGMDQLLFREKLGAVGPHPPNRIAPNTAMNFFLIGSALLFLNVETRQGRRPAQYLVLTGALASFLGLVGYAYGVPLYGVSSYIPMALNTALTFTLLYAGLLCARPDRGMMKIVTSGLTGGIMARRLLPAVIGIPLAIGWIRLKGQQAGLYNTEFGVALSVVVSITVLGIVVWRNALALDQIALARAKAEDESHRTEAFLNSVVENIPNMIFVKEAKELRFVRFNKAGEALLGYSREELIGKNDHDFFPKEEADFFTSKDRLVLTDGKLVDIPEEPIQTRHLGARILHTRKIPIFDQNGNPQFLLGISEDITERRRVEEERDRFFDLSLDMVCIAGFDGYFKQLNPAWEATLGWQNDELLSKPYIEFIHPDDRGPTMTEAQNLSSGKVTISFENRYLCKDGSYKWLQWKAFPMVSQQLIYATARDFTERKRSEEEIVKLNKDLEQKATQLSAANKELEAFSYSVSHDLRAPLRGIDGFSQALLEDYADQLDAEGKGYLQRVRAASQRMAQLIDDMLNLSRVTRGEMRREPVDLSAMAKAIAAELRETQPDRRADVMITEGLRANGDPRLLRVVMENLIGNAWKYTGKRPEARIEVGRMEDNGKSAYFVRDNGAGFDMACAGKLFGAFQRLHGVNEFPGTGIGLATIQRIIHRHGGRVWAEAAVEKGATFYFTL